METKTITLKNPIQVDGKAVSSLTLSEPTLACLDDIGIKVSSEGSVNLNLGDLHKLVANIASIPPSAAKTIKLSDFAEVAVAAMGFLPEFLRTGES